MSGIIDSVGSKSGVIGEIGPRDKPWKFIYQGVFNFQYGGGTWSTGYTLPQNITNGSGSDSRKYYWIRTNWGDGRWNGNMIVMGSPTNSFYGQKLADQWNQITVSAGGLISIVNQNGGTSGDLSGEIRVWLMESFEYTKWNYGGST
jgi:hypothetical protein